MKRLFKAFRFAAILFGGLIAIALIYYGVSNWRASSRLEAKLAELRAAGQPVMLADLARPPIPPEDNAFTFLKRAEEGISAVDKEVNAAEEAEEKARQERVKAGEEPAAENSDDDAPPTPIVLAAMRAALAAYPDAVRNIDRASECSDFDAQIDTNTEAGIYSGNMLPMFSVIRGAVRVLSYQGKVQLADGHPDDALQTALKILRLSRLYDRQSTMVANMISTACCNMGVRLAGAALQAGPISGENHAALDAELAQHDPIAAARFGLRTERAFALEHYLELIARGIGWSSVMKNDACDTIELITRAIGSLSSGDNGSEIDAGFSKTLGHSGTLTSLIEPGLRAYLQTVPRRQASLRALRILNALTARTVAANDAAPGLDSLGLPAGETTDPFNGAPLHLRKLPEGWLIYSVGANLTDDGGDLVDNKDVGLGPRRAVVEHTPDGDPEPDE